MTLITGLYVFIQWSRIVIVFRVNSFLGPTINILYNMLVEISKFMLIYVIILLVFESSGRILFIRLDEYNTHAHAFTTLFSASLASFDFYIYDHSNMVLESEYGYVFIGLFLIITNVVLLNFIIAILSNTYNQLQVVSKAMYYKEVIKMRNIFEFDKYYSSLISFFIPYNALFLPLMPFVMCCKSKRLNNFLLNAAYLPIAVIGIIIFFVFACILAPISYFALVGSTLRKIFIRNKTGRERCSSVYGFLIMLTKLPMIIGKYF